MTDFTDLIDLAAERLGGAVLTANDEFFAPKENLLKGSRPVFAEGQYTDRGKWMDGWETRRRREPGHDWCVIRLGLPGTIRGFAVDTTHFKGNYPAECSIEGCSIEGNLDLDQITSAAIQWSELLPRSVLQGDRENLFATRDPNRFTHLRFNIFPDGGVARLRVYGRAVPDWSRLRRSAEVDLVAAENGGLVLASSDMFFGSRHNLIMPGAPMNMGDGWETRRRRGSGHDWVIVQLGVAGLIRRIEVDTSHFKGNAPESFSLDACAAEGAGLDALLEPNRVWSEILPRTRLQPHTRHYFENEIRAAGRVTHVRFNIYPDGGVGRLRAFGTLE